MPDAKGGEFGAFGLSREDLLLILFLVWLFTPGFFGKNGVFAEGTEGLFGRGGDFNQLLVILLFLVLSGGWN